MCQVHKLSQTSITLLHDKVICLHHEEQGLEQVGISGFVLQHFTEIIIAFIWETLGMVRNRNM